MGNTTLHDARLLRDNPDFKAKILPSRHAKLSAACDRREAQLQQILDDGRERILEELKGSAVRLRQGRNDVGPEIAEITRLVDVGRMNPDEARKRITAVFHNIVQQRQLLTSLQRTVATAEAQADIDPADYEEELLKRFPVTTPAIELTDGWLAGAEEFDPLPEPRRIDGTKRRPNL